MTGQLLISQRLQLYKNEVEAELYQILSYWINYAQDTLHGGFFGKIDHHNQVYETAPKGSVLNFRILWAFSAAYNLEGKIDYLEQANRAFAYIKKYFFDPVNGGVYWSVDYLGNPLDTKKQIYAQAFAIYGLTEYHLATNDQESLGLAKNLYSLLVDKSYDKQYTGYFEAFTIDWQPLNDLRLSAKDANEKKTMNTHLHILEAYTNLYRVWPDDGVKHQIITLLNNFLDHIIDPESKHLVLFFDEFWNRKSGAVSFGHDIEAAWLLLESAEVITDEWLIQKLENVAVEIADATLGGFDKDMGLWYEYNPAEYHLIKEKHWWVQAEAMVGYFTAWQITKKENYLRTSLSNWEFVKRQILDKKNGEWIWGIGADGDLMPNEDKVGIWKCPYHNSRACMELIKRIK